jgi:hypothetical protein
MKGPERPQDKPNQSNPIHTATRTTMQLLTFDKTDFDSKYRVQKPKAKLDHQESF